MSKRPSNYNPNNKQDTEKLLNELTGNDQRSQCIVGAAWLEAKLSELIASFMVDKGETKNLLENGALQNFGVKINAAYCLGLLTDTQYKNLKLIQDIRNAFAHQIDLRTFKDPWVAAKCNELVCYGLLDPNGIRQPIQPGDIYVRTILEIAMHLMVNVFDDVDPEKRTIPPDTVRINYELD